VEGLSALLSAAGIGATVSALWLAHGGAGRTSPRLVLLAFLGLAASVVGLSLAWSLPAGVLAMVALGGSYELCRTGSVTMLQTSIPDALRGRVMSTWFLLLRGAGAVGVVATGALAESWGLRAPLLAGAGLAMLAGVVTYRRRARITRAFEHS
jgi:predicted MFS family arabinose efflux permease